MTLGENIKFLREQRKMTYEAVGAAVGTDGQNIFNMEKRKSKVSRFAPALAKLFNVELDELMQSDMSAEASSKVESNDGKNLIATDDAMRLLYLFGRMDGARRTLAMTILEGL